MPISFSPSFSRSQLGSSKMQYLHTTERDELVRESQQSDTLETENMIRADEKSTTRVCKCEVERDTALAEERSHRYASVRKAPQLTTGCSELAPSITHPRIPLHISFLSFPADAWLPGAGPLRMQLSTEGWRSSERSARLRGQNRRP